VVVDWWQWLCGGGSRGTSEKKIARIIYRTWRTGGGKHDEWRDRGEPRVGNRTDSPRLPIEIQRDTGVDRGERITVTAKAAWSLTLGLACPCLVWRTGASATDFLPALSRQRRRRANLASAAASQTRARVAGSPGPTTSVLSLNCRWQVRTVRCRQPVAAKQESSLPLRFSPPRQGSPASDGHTCVVACSEPARCGPRCTLCFPILVPRITSAGCAVHGPCFKAGMSVAGQFAVSFPCAASVPSAM
jgi:hypothetical protein